MRSPVEIRFDLPEGRRMFQQLFDCNMATPVINIDLSRHMKVCKSQMCFKEGNNVIRLVKSHRTEPKSRRFSG